VQLLEDVLPLVSQVLIMSVNPGFGGQKYLSNAEAKIRWLNKRRQENDNDYLIAVDGGVNLQTAAFVKNAGADVLVSGSYLFQAENRTEAIAALRKI